MDSVLHVDVNGAFLSWTAVELLKAGLGGDIRLAPSVIAGDPEARHGIVLAKSEPAKRFGITTAMTLAEAKRQCPGLLVFPPDHRLYGECSDRMFALLSEYSDVIERFSIDECWVDYTGSEKLFGDPVAAAHSISRRMREELGFTVNVGVSTNKFLSKMASEREKPDRVHTLYPWEIEGKLWPLRVREMFGVGRQAEKALLGLGIHTIGDVARTDPAILRNALKPALGNMLHECANGIDTAPVMRAGAGAAKSIGNSATTPHDVTDEAGAARVLLYLAEKVGMRMRKGGHAASSISIQLKNNVFRTCQHQRRLDPPIATAAEIHAAACEMFAAAWRGDPLRLLGITVSGLVQAEGLGQQLSMFEGEGPREKDLAAEAAEDMIRERFGSGAIRKGTLLGDGEGSGAGKIRRLQPPAISASHRAKP